MKQPKPHWLSPAGKSSTPRIIVTFDTETSETDAGDHTVMVLRCWDALVRVRSDDSLAPRGAYWHRGESPPVLADVIELASTYGPEIWVLAHNVGFDLTVTSLPFILAERGWTPEALHLGDESSWWILVRDGHKIVITDSWSWLRCPLEDAAKDVGMRKTTLPGEADSLERWHRRCRHDVEILDRIMVTILDWWDTNDLGKFGITGAACGWRAMRKMTPERRILVGPDGNRTDFERRAIFGGRKEVYGVGRFRETFISDFDFNAAYATTAAAHELPTMPAKRWCAIDQLLTTPVPGRRDYIAEVLITTRVPCAPCRIDGEIWWPVGTFRTTLAGPEVRYALEVADSVTVIDYQPYKMGFALAQWAAWCLSVQYDQTRTVPDVVKRVAKGWGRSVLGRFAARTSRVIATRPATHLGWHLETGHDLDTGASLEWLTMGGVEQTIAKDVDGPDVFPAVLSFVEAHTRVALARVMAAQDPTTLLQCNTDGWWQMRTPRLSTYLPDGCPWPFQLSRKALERSLLVRGPNHVLSPHERRYAGIPRVAISDDDRTMKWHDWPGLRWQLEHGAAGQYHRPEREAVLSDHYVRRWVLATGETVPVTTDVPDGYTTTLVPWSSSWGRRQGDELGDYQVPTLTRLLDADPNPQLIVHTPLPDQPGRGFRYTPQAVRYLQPSDRRTIVPASPGQDEPAFTLASH